jgi:hypothetical protein
MNKPNEEWPSGWEEHRLDQIRWIAQNTTPTQRIEWLEQTLMLFSAQVIEQHRREGEAALAAWRATEPGHLASD